MKKINGQPANGRAIEIRSPNTLRRSRDGTEWEQRQNEVSQILDRIIQKVLIICTEDPEIRNDVRKILDDYERSLEDGPPHISP